MERSVESQARDHMATIRRNYPGFSSTFGPCSNECGNSGRGSGLCGECGEKLLAELSTPRLAQNYHMAVQHQAKCEAALMDYIANPEAAGKERTNKLEELPTRLRSGEYNFSDLLAAARTVEGFLELDAMINTATTPQIVGRKE